MRRVVIGVLVLSACVFFGSDALDTEAHGDIEVTTCDPTGAAPGDDINRGIVFIASRPFAALELLMGGAPGVYEIDLELRQSTGFVAPVVATSQETVNFGGTQVVHFDFDPAVPVFGLEMFSIKLMESGGFEDIQFAVGSPVEECPDVYETVENDVAEPTFRRPNTWLRVLSDAGLRFLWGDTTCDGTIEELDVLGLLRQVAEDVAATAGSGCPPLGDATVLDEFGNVTWGDWDCSGEMTGADALPLLEALSGVGDATQDCPVLGGPVEFVFV